MKTLALFIVMMMSFADQPRKVLVFYNNEGKQQWESQMDVLKAAQSGIKERDINVESISFSPQNESKWKKWKVEGSDTFTFILVGRDGGEKLRSSEVVKTDKLFGLIDAMPMRKNEVNEKNR